MDYEALAKQFGGKVVAPPAGGVDYEALAKQFGGQVKQAPSPFSSAVPQLDAQGQIIRQPAPLPSTEPSRGVMDVIAGVPEAALTLGSGAVAGTIAPFVAAGEEIFSGQYGSGTPKTERRAEELTQMFTYQPVSRTGQQIVGTIGEAVEGLGLEAIPVSQGLTAVTLGRPAVKQAVNIAGNEARLAGDAFQSIPAVRQAQEARVAGSFARGPQIDAISLAQKYEIGLDPAIANPTLRNRARAAAVGETDLNLKLSKSNEPKWTAAAKQSLGVGKETPLTNRKVFDDVRARPDISGPYDEVRKIPSIVVDEATISRLDDLKVDALFGDVGQAASVNAFLEALKTDLRAGGSGKKLLDSARQMRKEAQNAYKSKDPLTPEQAMVADAKMAASRVLEEMIDDSIPNVRARDAFANARKKMAETYEIEAATDFGTGKVDPQFFARLVSEGKIPVTGVVEDLGRIVANFPEIARIGAQSTSPWARLSRASLGGTLGGLVGLATGGPMGVPIGIAAGAGIGDITRRVAVNRMLTPGYQRSRAVPRDFRPQAPVNALRPVEPGQSNIVPFDPRMAPNFIFVRPDPDVRVGMQAGGPAQLPAPSAEGTIAALRAEDARRAAMSRQMGDAQEAQVAAAEAATPRQSAGSGVAFELDPVTGRLRPVQGGVQTPESTSVRLAPLSDTTLADLAAEAAQPPRKVLVGGKTQELGSRAPTVGGVEFNLDPATGRLTPVPASAPPSQTPGSSLSSAADKLSRGQRFALTADEMVAWNKTSVELAELMPGMKALSQKAIAEKMMDRKWVESALKKAVEKEEAFKLIERQSKDMQMVQQARIARESLMDAVEALQEALSRPRAKEAARTKGQGPKTRAAKNQLGQIETLNKLID
jgi:hypothetical protein